MMSKSPILVHPDYNKTFILSTDASEFAIAAELGHRDSYGIIHPIAYFSKKLNQQEIKYPIMEKELLAVVQALKSFKTYLYGRKFIIRCDNAALQTVRKLESPANRLSRWLLFLQEYDFKFELIPGKLNKVADIFSRDFHTVNSMQISIPHINQIKEEQYKDKNLAPLIQKLLDTSKQLTRSEENYFLRDSILMHSAYMHCASGHKMIEQVVIPDIYKPNILELGHMGHFAHKKTYDNIRQHYYWINLYEDTRHFVDTCKECYEYKTPKRFPPVPLQRHFIPERPLQYVSVDLIGKCSTTAKNNKYIITFVDHFTKFLKTYPMPSQDAETSADKFFDFITTFGTPEYLLSDLGRNFNSQLFKEVSKKLGVTKLYTTAMNPKSNGVNEITHKSLKKSISILARENAQWDTVLPFYEMLYNGTIHSTTKEKPSYLLLGYDIALPNGMLDPQYKPQYDSYPNFIQKKTEMLQAAYKNVHKNIIKSAEQQEIYQAKRSKPKKYNPGDLTFLYNPQLDRNTTLPKKRNYYGPMRILKQHNAVNYTIADVTHPHKRPQKVHIDRLIPYHERKPELRYNHENTQNPLQESSSAQDISLESSVKPHPRFSDKLDSEDEEEDIPLAYLIQLYSHKPTQTNIHFHNADQRSKLPQSKSSAHTTQSEHIPGTTLLPTPQEPATHDESISTNKHTKPWTDMSSDEEENTPLIKFTSSYNKETTAHDTPSQHSIQQIISQTRPALLPTPLLHHITAPLPQTDTPGSGATHSTLSSPTTIIYSPPQTESQEGDTLPQQTPPTPGPSSYNLRSQPTSIVQAPTEAYEQSFADRIFNWALKLTEDKPTGPSIESQQEPPEDID